MKKGPEALGAGSAKEPEAIVSGQKRRLNITPIESGQPARVNDAAAALIIAITIIAAIIIAIA